LEAFGGLKKKRLVEDEGQSLTLEKVEEWGGGVRAGLELEVGLFFKDHFSAGKVQQGPRVFGSLNGRREGQRDTGGLLKGDVIDEG